MNNPTMHDVANEAGVSIATVSRILNGMPGSSVETREHVLDVIRRIGYQRNEAARNLKTKTSTTIAVLVPHLTESFFATMMASIVPEARRRGFDTVICQTGQDGRDSGRFVNMLYTRAICGVIVLSLPPSSRVDRMLSDTRIPSVFINALSGTLDLPYVCIDDFQGMYESTKYLLETGHRRIAIVTGEINDEMTTRPRLEGYRQALADVGIDPDPALQADGSYEFEGAQVAFRRLMSRTRDFTAVVTCSDESALAVIREAQEAGLRVPEDLSVIGFDNSRLSSLVTPPLTSVAMPYTEMAQSALDILAAQIAGKENPGSRRIPLQLVLRGSTSPR